MDHFFWQPAPDVPAVRIGWPAIEGIEREVIEGFKALPRRGAEVGGALLGRRDPQTGDFTIESFEPIPIEYQSGPSYVLSDHDVAVWREHVAELRQRSPGFIGIYRSQTRPGLGTTPEDCAMVERHLPREEGVLLLVKPLDATECVGALFLCDGGAVLDEAVEARQFPFRKPGMPSSKTLLSKASSLKAPSKAKTSSSKAPPLTTGSWKSRLMSFWIPVTAALCGIAMALFIHYKQDQGGGGQAQENPVAAAVPATLGLHAEPNGSNARIQWDPASGLLDGATGATLNVADGDTHKALRLTAADLRNGYVEWPVRSRVVTFEMQLERPGQGTAGQSITWANPGYVINSSSDRAKPKPSPLAAASPQADEAREHAVPAPRAQTQPVQPLAIKAQRPGRVKRLVNGITSKASHLWPFRSAKPAQQTQ